MEFRFNDGRDWFFGKRFGLFIHWGIYAIDAWHEQMQYRNSIPKADYRPLMHRFNPVRFDPEKWLDYAQAHGFEYLTFTAKHIDGFCMWDTGQTDYKITNTPYGRDTLAMLAEACARRNFPLCIYYSTIDNDHPAYPHRGGSYEKPTPEQGEVADLEAYLSFIHAQIDELCTGYGEISGFWWDCNAVDRIGVTDMSFNEQIRSLQPKAVINSRGFSDGDFDTPERDWGHEATERPGAFERPVEACQSIGIESWGYRSNEDYYTPRHLEASIARSLARGGNYLLNVGPKPDGSIPEKASRVLDPLGKWLETAREALTEVAYATPAFTNNSMGIRHEFEVTRRANTLYVILTGVPTGSRVLLKPVGIAPKRAVLLGTGEEIGYRIERLPSEWLESDPYLRLTGIDDPRFATTVPIIRLDFDRSPLRS